MDGFNEKYANARLKKIDALMDQLRKQIGKKGDGQNGGSTSLIGAVEGLNNEAYDGKELELEDDLYSYRIN